jgi:signal transduction histidine kinase
MADMALNVDPKMASRIGLRARVALHLQGDVEGCAEQYRRAVIARFLPESFDPEHVRALVLMFALAVAVLAVITDPGTPTDLVLAAIPVGAFAAWARGLPLVVLAIGVIVPVVVAQRDGQLEPLFFEVSLLGFAAGRWAPSLGAAIGIGFVATAAPIAAGVIQDPTEIAVGIWIIGIAFPWALGLAAARQSRLVTELDATRRELAEQALLAERRRIARDVHDLVGHGLAAVMLQVTSARHVLRRDPAAAEEALRSAEGVGRRSMRDLRRTVAFLRSDDESATAPPLPSANDIPALVDEARFGGLAVELRESGELSRIAPSVGVALYRIAQEAVSNAARHAPRARTVLELELTDGFACLVAETSGPMAAAPDSDRERPQYGLIGMRERAAALGGELSAGPTPAGWRVSCRIPLEATDAAPPRDVSSP